MYTWKIYCFTRANTSSKMKLNKRGDSMNKLSLKEISVPLIKSIDSFNYLLKSHHRRTAIISYYLGQELGLNQHDLTTLVIAASIHDIGALSIQERNLLILEDVENPRPHCEMGFKMLAPFEAFNEVSQIIRHHHIKYNELEQTQDLVLFQSHIVHLADRIDILISPDSFILDQRDIIYNKILARTGTIFHPDVVSAFNNIKQKDIFWININNMSIEQLFDLIEFPLELDLSVEKIIRFSQTIANIVDFRSHFTISHSYTVASLAYNIGLQLGYDEDFRNKLLVAGYLHDIGKIGIDPGIIEKTGKLTTSEYNQIRLHSYYSGEILKELSNHEWFKEVVMWSRSHHEKNDGTGYPYAETNNLCDGCKILEFADMIAALTEERPYRNKLTIEEALDIIEESSARKVDYDMFQEIKKEKDNYQIIIDNSHKITKEAYEKNYSIQPLFFVLESSKNT